MSIQDFFKGRNVLVTGATGFMGKVLIEKLVRSCPDIGKICLLVRNKKGKDTNSRIKEILDVKVCFNLNTLMLINCTQLTLFLI